MNPSGDRIKRRGRGRRWQAALLALLSACLAPPDARFSGLPPEVRDGLSPASCVALLCDRYDGGLTRNPLALGRILQRLAPMGRQQVLDVLGEYTQVRAVLPYRCEHGSPLLSTPSPQIARAVCLAMFEADLELLPPPANGQSGRDGSIEQEEIRAWRPTYPLLVIGGLPFYVRHDLARIEAKTVDASFDDARAETWVAWASQASYRGWDREPVDNLLEAVDHFLWSEYQEDGWPQHFTEEQRAVLRRVLRLQAYTALEGCADALLESNGLARPTSLAEVTGEWWRSAVEVVGPRTRWEGRKRRYRLK